jgi:recombinase
MLTNPAYAGAYAFGKSEARTKVVDGRARRSFGHDKPRSAWMVLIRDHHPGYISWEEYEQNQAMIAANTFGHSDAEPKPAGAVELCFRVFCAAGVVEENCT